MRAPAEPRWAQNVDMIKGYNCPLALIWCPLAGPAATKAAAAAATLVPSLRRNVGRWFPLAAGPSNTFARHSRAPWSRASGARRRAERERASRPAAPPAAAAAARLPGRGRAQPVAQAASPPGGRRPPLRLLHNLEPAFAQLSSGGKRRAN